MGQYISSISRSNRIETQTELCSNRTTELERQESSARTEELTQLREENNLLQREIRAQSKKINQQRRSLNRRLHRLQRYTDQITELEKDLRSKTEEKRSLDGRLERLQSHHINDRNQITEEVRTLTEERDSLQRNSTTQANRIIELESESRSKTEEIRRLTEERDRLRRQRSSNRQLNSDWKINTYDLKIRRNECLGRGGWGAVYRAKFHGCHVAVKEMHENIISTHNRRLFEREAEMASRCRHPCLLQFIGATSSNRPLIVTEIMEGSLRARLNNQGEPPLSEQEITVISLDVAAALNYLHNKPEIIIHRDISSSNVLLRRQGDQWRAKLSDYGTVNSQSQSSRNDAGAPIYQAPESVNQEPHMDINIKVSAPAL